MIAVFRLKNGSEFTSEIVNFSDATKINIKQFNGKAKVEITGTPKNGIYEAGKEPRIFQTKEAAQD